MPLPDKPSKIAFQIMDAFSGCRRPSIEELAPWGGPDRPGVESNWGEINREMVTQFDHFGDVLAEDLSSMSSVGLRHFLPAVFTLFLENPERISDLGFVLVVRRLEGLAGLDDSIDSGFYRPIALTQEQNTAIGIFCSELLATLGNYDLITYDYEEECRERLERLCKTLSNFRETEDYDAEFFQSIAIKDTSKRID